MNEETFRDVTSTTFCRSRSFDSDNGIQITSVFYNAASFLNCIVSGTNIARYIRISANVLLPWIRDFCIIKKRTIYMYCIPIRFRHMEENLHLILRGSII